MKYLLKLSIAKVNQSIEQLECINSIGRLAVEPDAGARPDAKRPRRKCRIARYHIRCQNTSSM
jgi:hypothetical protein